MDSAELVLAGLAGQLDLLRAGEVSSRELTGASLERIGALDPEINAFRIVLAERALVEADEADRRRAAGEDLPLLGVPVAVKDNLDVAGEMTTHGTSAFPGPVKADSEYFRRIHEAGAVLVGKTTCPELSIFGFTETDAWGVTRNPWDLTRSTGGSSGGSAAAVAAGMVAAASGSDGAGSIRIPASNCGLFGLKPQRGRISLDPLHEHWYGMSQLGCLTRRVLDTALWLDATAGPSPTDPLPPPAPSGTYAEAASRDPGKLRIAVSTTPARSALPPKLDDRVVAAIEATASVMRSLGHEVVERAPDYGMVGNGVIPRYLSGIAEDYDLVPFPDRLEQRTRGMGRLGRAIPRRLLRHARSAERAHAGRINAIFDDFDAILTPVAAEPPIGVGRWAGKGALATLLEMSRTYPYTAIWNYTGQPAASVPAPVPAGSAPIGAMLVVAPNREELLISLAAQFERETAWPDRVPAIAETMEEAA